jgi:uncharacterized membrane protein
LEQVPVSASLPAAKKRIRFVMMEATGAFWRWLVRKVRAHFLAGLLIVIPLGITVWILYQGFSWIDNFLQDAVIERVFGHPIPGIGFGITVVLIYIVGAIASNVFGRRMIRYGESLLGRVPIARNIYSGTKQIMESFSAPNKTGFMQVVLVEFPRRGTRTIGFITNEQTDESGKKLINVFIPTSPNPTSGFLQILEEEEVIRTTISVDAAIKMVVSGGRMSPDEVRDKLLIAREQAAALDSAIRAVDLPHGGKEVVGRKTGGRNPHSSG